MKAFVLFWLLSLTLYAQQWEQKAAGCGTVMNTHAWQNYEAYEYQKSIVSLLQPPERALVSVSVFETGNTPKYFLRMKASNVFELIRASSKEPLPAIIDRLCSAGQLPVSPIETIKLVDLKWESKVLSPAEFKQIYGGFSEAFTQYASNIAKRPLKDGDRIILHAPDFSIGYETAGFETFEITAMRSSDQQAEVDDPMAKWAIGFLDYARRRFDSGSKAQ